MKGIYYIDKKESQTKLTELAADYNGLFMEENADGERRTVWKGSRKLGALHIDILKILIFRLIKENGAMKRTDLKDLCSQTTSITEIKNLHTDRVSKTDAYRPFSKGDDAYRNALKRLVEAKIIEMRQIKGLRGFLRITLKPNLLHIIDMETNLLLFSEKTSKSADYPNKDAKCGLYQYSKKNKNIKSNTPGVDKAESGQKPDASKKTFNKTETGNTRKVVKKSGAAQEPPESFFAKHEKIQGLAADERNRKKLLAYQMENRKYNTVLELYKEIMGLVFTPTRMRFSSYGEVLDHPFVFRQNLQKLNHHREHGEALNILLKYFADTKTDEQVEILARRLHKSAELARRHLLRKSYNIDYLTPTRFLRRGKFSLVNVHDEWLPAYLTREQKRIEKISNDKDNIELAQKKAKFRQEADLLLAQVRDGASITMAAQYVSTFYGATFQNWFMELLEQSIVGDYRPKSVRPTVQTKEFLLKVFSPDSYIEENEPKVLSSLRQYMKNRTYTNSLASSLEFKDPMFRANPVGIRHPETFNDFAFRNLLFA